MPVGPSVTAFTFLFTDIEGSTRVWEEQESAMADALSAHDQILALAVRMHSGRVFKHVGDGVCAVFARAADGIAAAARAQQMLAEHPWGPTGELKVRIGVHSGDAVVRDGDYYGRTLNATARLMSSAHGQQVLVSATALAAAGGELPTGWRAVDLGEHHLRDLATVMRIHQLSGPGLPESFPPLSTLGAAQGNLPLRWSALVGRQPELAALSEALAASRIVTLTGFGGVGKTRLAVHAAAEVLSEFRDGAWLCELGALEDGTAVAASVAATLGVREGAGPLLESIAQSLVPRQLLLILDNCEHVIDVAASVAAFILSRCPEVKILATSRQPLGIEGERVMAISPLSSQAPGRGGAGVSDAAELFIHRAQAANDSFAAGPEAMSTIERICRRLDGLPLAIELTAARTASMSVGEIDDRLAERFRLVAGGRAPHPDRHVTLRATVDWSYSLLDERERDLADSVAVFAGGFTREAVEAVCAQEGALESADNILEGLVAKSIVTATTGGRTARFQMLETLRDYGMERLLVRGAVESLRTRHAEYYARLAERSVAGLRGAEEAAWVERVASDFDNLRAAAAFATKRGDVDVALRLNAAMLDYAFWRQRFECGDWASEAAALPGAATHPLYPATAAMAGVFIGARGDVPRALALAASAMAAEEAAGLEKSWLLRLGLGLGAAIGGQAAMAAVFDEQMIELARATADPAVVALCLAQKLVTEANFRDVGGELDLAREALELARSLDNPTRIAWALWAQSVAYRESNLERAIELAEECVVVASAVDNRHVQWTALTGLSVMRARHGDPSGARQGLLSALAQWHAAGNWGELWPALRETVCLLAALAPAAEVVEILGACAVSPWAAAMSQNDRERQAAAVATLEAALGTEAVTRAREAGARLVPEQTYRLAVALLETSSKEMVAS